MHRLMLMHLMLVLFLLLVVVVRSLHRRLRTLAVHKVATGFVYSIPGVLPSTHRKRCVGSFAALFQDFLIQGDADVVLVTIKYSMLDFLAKYFRYSIRYKYRIT